MTVVFKYPLAITDVQTVEMYSGASILDCQLQDDRIMMWCLVDPTRGTFKTTIYIFATGEPIDIWPLDFIATVQRKGNVWHVFREVR
jgi:hypothetical protein